MIGDGPEHKRLQAMAGPTIRFIPKVSDQERNNYFEAAEAFIFPVVEDFGIVAVEALAAGTPVIAYQAGGALDYVIESKNGLFFPKQTVASLTQILKTFHLHKFDHDLISRQAKQFDTKNFVYRFTEFINSVDNIE